MLIVFMPHTTYFMTSLHSMAVSVVTKINFLELGNLCM